MTVSKSDLLITAKYVSKGKPFANIGANETVNSTGMFFLSKGRPFYGPNNTTPIVITAPTVEPTRKGRPFDWTTGNETINASEFDYTIKGQPFYVPYNVTPPSGFNTTQFFMVF